MHFSLISSCLSFSQVLILLVMILFSATGDGTKVAQVAAGQVAHFSGALLVFLPLVLASHPSTQVRSVSLNKRDLTFKSSVKVLIVVSCLSQASVLLAP